MQVKRTCDPTVRPIQIFHQRVEVLKAAIVVARATPKKGPIHDLRTATRCVEAQLNLLDMLSGLPPHKDKADELQKRLRRVRQATGAIRDLDVLRDLIRKDISASDKWDGSTRDNSTHHGAQQLRRHLKRERDQKTIEFRQALCREEPKLASALLTLEDTLKPAKDRVVAVAALARCIERWFALRVERRLASASATQIANQRKMTQFVHALKKKALHQLRKDAKLCRCMAEILPESHPVATQMADRFKMIHDAGGRWHDWLLLVELAAQRKGKRARLTQRYSERQVATLTEYQVRLVDLLPLTPFAVAHRTDRASADPLAKTTAPRVLNPGAGGQSSVFSGS